MYVKKCKIDFASNMLMSYISLKQIFEILCIFQCHHKHVLLSCEVFTYILIYGTVTAVCIKSFEFFLVTLTLTGTDHAGLTDVAQGPLCCPTSQINSPPLVNTRSSGEHSGVTNFVALLTWIGSLLLLGFSVILLH